MNLIRSEGRSGSIGKKAAPDLSMANIDVTSKGPLGSMIGMISSRPTSYRLMSSNAHLFAMRFSPSYVMVIPLWKSAVLWGVFFTCNSNTSCMYGRSGRVVIGPILMLKIRSLSWSSNRDRLRKGISGVSTICRIRRLKIDANVSIRTLVKRALS